MNKNSILTALLLVAACGTEGTSLTSTDGGGSDTARMSLGGGTGGTGGAVAPDGGAAGGAGGAKAPDGPAAGDAGLAVAHDGSAAGGAGGAAAPDGSAPGGTGGAVAPDAQAAGGAAGGGAGGGSSVFAFSGRALTAAEVAEYEMLFGPNNPSGSKCGAVENKTCEIILRSPGTPPTIVAGRCHAMFCCAGCWDGTKCHVTLAAGGGWKSSYSSEKEACGSQGRMCAACATSCASQAGGTFACAP
jgi:hypothetical protein